MDQRLPLSRVGWGGFRRGGDIVLYKNSFSILLFFFLISFHFFSRLFNKVIFIERDWLRRKRIIVRLLFLASTNPNNLL